MIHNYRPAFLYSFSEWYYFHFLLIVWTIIQELEDWLEEASHRDEDAMTLMKYAKIDDAKIKVFIRRTYIILSLSRFLSYHIFIDKCTTSLSSGLLLHKYTVWENYRFSEKLLSMNNFWNQHSVMNYGKDFENHIIWNSCQLIFNMPHYKITWKKKTKIEIMLLNEVGWALCIYPLLKHLLEVWIPSLP